MPTINWMQEIERENKRDQLEAEAHPFFVIVLVIVGLFTAEIIYDEYASKQDHAAMSSMVAACANGKTVQFGDAVMKCEVKQMVASNE